MRLAQTREFHLRWILVFDNQRNRVGLGVLNIDTDVCLRADRESTTKFARNANAFWQAATTRIKNRQSNQRDVERWSIQENAGHLLDLESLVKQRLDEYLSGATALHAADMSNRKTYEADHNQVSMTRILGDFREQRTGLVKRLDELAPETFASVAHHPRLNVPMRLVDMMFFQAEHDDYHLARISELIRLFVG